MSNIRYVIRHPSIHKTPGLLAEALGAKTRQWPNEQPFLPSYKNDFIFNMPEPHFLHEAQTGEWECVRKAEEVFQFFRKNKPSQRAIIGTTLPIPWTSTHRNTWNGGASRFVVRPLRHSKSRNYRVTDNPNDFIEGAEYVSELFFKEREYRIVYIFGYPVVVLRKRVEKDVGPELPWGFENSSFRTINDVSGSFVSRCGALEDIRRHQIIKSSHIVGVDILWRKGQNHHGEYKVLEFNSAPALTIEKNIEKVANFIKERQD